MISRKNRFHGHRSVSRVKGSLSHSKHLSIRYAKNSKKDYRLAVVVSKKIDTRAVVRNRIRRRIFEAFRTQKRLQNLPVDIVLYVKSVEAAVLSSRDLNSEISGLTTKAISSVL